MIATVTGRPELGGLREVGVEADDWREVGACPVCARADRLLVVAELEGEQPGTRLSACTRCEVVFLSRRPSPEWFAAFYSSDWDEGGRARTADAGFRPRPTSKVLEFCAAELPIGAAVLDAGAGFGGELLGFRAAGHEPHALEASGHRAEFLRDRLGIPTWSAPMEEVEPGRGFDLVYMQHVLEHVADPRAAVEAARALLEPDGLLYLAVPNLWHEHPPQTIHFVPHQTVFTRAALDSLVESCGFELRRSVETTEVRLLARRTDRDGGGAPAESDSGFAERVTEWASAPFRLPSASGALVWAKSKRPGVEFEATPVAGRLAGALVRRAHALEKRLPSAPRELFRRMTPDYVSARTIRVLPVTLSGEPGLPVTVRYERRRPPVWVK